MSDFGSSDRGAVAGKTYFSLVFEIREKGSIVAQISLNFATPTNSMIVGDTLSIHMSLNG